MTSGDDPSESPPPPPPAFVASRADRDRTLEAVRALETAIGMAGPGREAAWQVLTSAHLRDLEAAVAEERGESLRPSGLLSMINSAHPRRFGARIRRLQKLHDDIIEEVDGLRADLADQPPDRLDINLIRERVSRTVRAVHTRRQLEADLVYEALEYDLGAP